MVVSENFFGAFGCLRKMDMLVSLSVTLTVSPVFQNIFHVCKECGNCADSQPNYKSTRRLACDEHPLERWLCWTDDIDSHQFVLQDNVTSEVAVSFNCCYRVEKHKK